MRQMFDSHPVYRHLLKASAAITASFFKSCKTHLTFFIERATYKDWRLMPAQSMYW